MMGISPLGVLISIVIVGITIEVVEQQSKPAAYGLAILVLLGMITFNAAAFSRQITAIVGVANRKQVQKKSSGTTAK